jgi:hypothetical protein
MKVFLIHGMGRTTASLFLLRMRLARAGHTPHVFGYSVARESFARIVERFVATVAGAVRSHEPYAILGHSLGNVIARAASPALPRGLARLVMLAPPNNAPILARKLDGNPVFELLAGDAGRRLRDATFYDTLPVPPVPTLVIAGTGGPRLRFHPHGEEPSDGVVTVAETRLRGAEHREVPCLHTFIMNNAAVARLALEFLSSSVPVVP